MQIKDYMSCDLVFLDSHSNLKEKEEAILFLIDKMCESGNIKDAAAYKKAVFSREAEISTGFGKGIAIPHAKSQAVTKPRVCLLISRDGVAYNSLDEKPAHLIFLLAIPESEPNLHIEILSHISELLRGDTLRNALRQANSEKEAFELIEMAEEKRIY